MIDHHSQTTTFYLLKENKTKIKIAFNITALARLRKFIGSFRGFFKSTRLTSRYDFPTAPYIN